MEHGQHKGYTMSYDDDEYLRKNTLHGQCKQFREACIELVSYIAKMLRLYEVCDWLERFLRRFKKRQGGCECGVLSCRYVVDEVSRNYLLEFNGKVNAEEMTFGSLTFDRGQLLLTKITVEQPPDARWEVVLTFKIHTDKWTTHPKVMVPRWSAWRGYKIVQIKGPATLEYTPMQELIDYLAELHTREQ